MNNRFFIKKGIVSLLILILLASFYFYLLNIGEKTTSIIGINSIGDLKFTPKKLIE